VLLLKLHGKPFNISFIMVYAPTSESSEEEIGHQFYNTLDKAKCRPQDIIIIMDELNAKLEKNSTQ